MADKTAGAWQRREFMAGLALFGAALGASLGPADEALAAARRKAARLAPHQALMRDVAQLVIPRTGTAGAGEVGAGTFVLLALDHGLDGTRRPLADALRADPAVAAFARPDGSLDHASWLAAELAKRAGRPFAVATPAQRQSALAALDHDAFAKVPAAQPWHPIKNLILTGYYTSEIGGSKELNYELVPGRWDPDVPVTPTTRSYSSDWTAIDFG